jgi:allantoinase
VHAENDALTARSRGPTARDWLESRPVVAELEAIGRAIAFAEDTGCALHIVHVSCGRGVALVTAARERGVDVTCETCPHYLFLTPEDVEALGPVAKCAPPVREDPDLPLSEIDMVTSDHSPSSPELKAGEFGAAWGGIAGAQTTRELLLGACEPEEVVRLTSTGPAERFGLAGLGRIEVGAEANLALVRVGDERVLTAGELRYRHKLSPWIGRTLRARVVRTLLRGRDPEPGAGRLMAGSRPC